MGVILDTSVLIAAERGIFDVDAFVANREEEPFGLSVITVAELLHGVHRADSRARRIRRNAFVETQLNIGFDRLTARRNEPELKIVLTGEDRSDAGQLRHKFIVEQMDWRVLRNLREALRDRP